MAHFKRRKSKRRVRCTMCTKYRWMGNTKGRHRERADADRKRVTRAIRERGTDE